ncbi:MAG: DNA polymerase [Actinomycetota bacterium]
MNTTPADLAIEQNRFAALAIHPGVGMGIATAAGTATVEAEDPAAVLTELVALDSDRRPRWVWWDRSTADLLAEAGVSVSRCWDVLTVNRLLRGGWRTSIAEVWALLNDLDPETIPKMGQLDLLSQTGDDGGDQNHPVRPDGHLRPEWIDGGWCRSVDRLADWASLALVSADRQLELLDDRPDPGRAVSTANAESAAELLAAELAFHGLPIDEPEAIRIITEAAGPRPTNLAEEEAEQRRRDGEVLKHLDPPQSVNLRNPGDVKAMLGRTGLDLPDTRAWRLEKLRDTDPLIDALLVWRKAERIATTYGFGWLDEHVSGGRLRGEWTGSDGAAGRMTASAGLHNLPAPMRPAVAAESGFSFVRADLGQIEPRVLAAVSGDQALIAATADDDLYQPVAKRLGVERDIAKVAVLGAMYGATTGESAGALRGLQQNYPVAMAHLEAAAEEGKRGRDIFTIGGRRVRMGGGSSPDGDIDRAIAAAESRGRYARNALIQGAAAEFFKVWAIIVKRRVTPLDGRVVLCLHDELLVHAPTEHAAAAADQVAEAVTEAAFYWSPNPDVRFLADVGVIQRWSEAKD